MIITIEVDWEEPAARGIVSRGRGELEGRKMVENKRLGRDKKGRRVKGKKYKVLAIARLEGGGGPFSTAS